MSFLNNPPPRLQDRLPTMASSPLPTQSKPKPKKTPTKHPCTPFCDPKVDCPKHHDMVLTLMNCNDCPGAKSNVPTFQQCVLKCIDEGWDKDDVVPDVSQELRFPLVHLACSFGKCLALDWLLQYGFDPNVKSESTGQFAMQRAIVGMYRARNKGTSKELIPKLKKIIAAIPKQLQFHDEVNGDTPLHTAAAMLTSVDQKSQFFESCIEVIAKEAFKLDCPPSTILDAINYEGKTTLHILASSNRKVEFCASAIRALVSAGADKTIRDNNGETALDIAFSGGVQNIVQELLRDGEVMGSYSELDQESEIQVTTLSHTFTFPSPSPTDDSDTNWSERASSRSSINEHLPLATMASIGIKREIIETEDNENSACGCSEDEDTTPSVSSSSPAVLKYLGDAGLLGDVSALVARARAQDEANMRKLESRAKEIDVHIKNKEQCIQKMKQELSNLRSKRNECDEDYEKIRKRMRCCESAMKELPNL